MKEKWSRQEIAKITGIPDRRILFYSEQNIIPGFVKTVGRGTPRAYSTVNLFYLLLIKELDALGLSLTRIRAIIAYLEAWTLTGKLNLWIHGTFTKEPVVIIISLHPEDHALSQDSENYNEEFEMQTITGSTDIKLIADRPSQIIINLNQIFEKAGL